MPRSAIATLSSEISTLSSASPQQNALLQQLPKPIWRQSLSELFSIWREDNAALSGEAIATALLCAHHCIAKSKEDLSVEVVWTGPEASTIPLRRD